MLLFIPLFAPHVHAGLGSSGFPPAALCRSRVHPTLHGPVSAPEITLEISKPANLQIHISSDRGRGSTLLTWATVGGKGIVLEKKQGATGHLNSERQKQIPRGLPWT